jgi:hypothetical protein
MQQSDFFLSFFPVVRADFFSTYPLLQQFKLAFCVSKKLRSFNQKPVRSGALSGAEMLREN